MTLASFVVMYVLMYAMVDRLGNALPNINEAYMAGLMAAPMVFIELVLMRAMYRNRALNLVFAGTASVLLLLCWIGIRQQVAVSDQQFLRSMIPHHAGAILMCGQANLRSPDLQALCREIRRSQQREIDFMKARLK
jgi:uncharacterized protein (DUF305 family)